MSLTIRMPKRGLVGVSDLNANDIDTSVAANDNTTLSRNSVNLLRGATVASFNVNLPTTDVVGGDVVIIKDLTTGNNAPMVSSALIQGTNQTIELNHNSDFELIYINDTQGWVILG